MSRNPSCVCWIGHVFWVENSICSELGCNYPWEPRLAGVPPAVWQETCGCRADGSVDRVLVQVRRVVVPAPVPSWPQMTGRGGGCGWHKTKHNAEVLAKMRRVSCVKKTGCTKEAGVGPGPLEVGALRMDEGRREVLPRQCCALYLEMETWKMERTKPEGSTQFEPHSMRHPPHGCPSRLAPASGNEPDIQSSTDAGHVGQWGPQVPTGQDGSPSLRKPGIVGLSRFSGKS